MAKHGEVAVSEHTPSDEHNSGCRNWRKPERESQNDSHGAPRPGACPTSLRHERRTPPFGRHLLRLSRTGGRPANSIWVFMGSDAWGAIKTTIDAPKLLLPPGALASEYRWPVCGMDCFIEVRGKAEADEILDLARQLLLSGAPFVNILAKHVFNREILTVRPRPTSPRGDA